MNNDHLKLCLLTHAVSLSSLKPYLTFLEQAIEGGVTSIQFRDKQHKPAERYELASQLKAFLSSYAVPFIINDDLPLAQEINADGVHLGQSDASPAYARSLLGPDKIIGLSIETLSQLHSANQLTCIDYIGASAVFPSETKTNCQTMWGLDGLKQLATQSIHPVVAIGGIHEHNIRDVMQQGAHGVAVIAAIHTHPSPFNAAKLLIDIIHQESL